MTKKKMQIARFKEQFEVWVTFIPDRLIALSEILHKINIKLDNSKNSIEELEEYLLKNYTFEDCDKEDKMYIIELCATYIGHYVQNNIPNAHWDIILEDSKNIHFNSPLLRINDDYFDFNPFSAIKILLSKQQKGSLLHQINQFNTPIIWD
jgi:hypothetical protein